MKLYEDMTKDELIQEKESINMLLDEYRKMNLKLDMTRGKPSTEQLSLSNDLYDEVVKSDFKDMKNEDCRNYGVPAGIEEVREIFADVLDTDKENIYVGNSSSLNLIFDTMMRAMVFGEIDSERPWALEPKKKWICLVPGYDRHFKITEQLGFELINVPILSDGPDVDMIEKLVAEDETIKGFWAVPCYSNPDGVVFSEEKCRRLAAMKTKAKDFRIFWDNAYCVHHLYDDEKLQGKVPDILGLCAEYGNPNRVYEFTSTSKITFAGAGISCMAANKESMDRARKLINVQTIGPNKINQLAHAIYFKNADGVKRKMSEHAKILRPKFDMTLDILDKELTGTGVANWHKPLGGYFVSIFVYPGTAKKVISMCNELGVAFTPAGATYPYGIDPDDSNIRIAPSFPEVDAINKAISVFSLCVKSAAIDELLSKK